MVDDNPFQSKETEDVAGDKKSFWVLLIVLFVGFAFYQWYFSVTQQVSRNIKRLSHPHAMVSAEAWEDLQQLFFYEWDAFETILENLDNRDPVTFLIILNEEESQESEARKLVFKAVPKPLFYRTEVVYCNTVREALFALIHNDEKTQVPYDGNWETWWRDNRKYFR